METAGEKSVGFGDSTSELEHLREELRLCRLELAQARADQEEVLEKQASVRRSKVKAQKESDVFAKALVDALLRETRERVRRRWWRPGRGGVSQREWAQVQILWQSKYFRPAWYLRENLDIARGGVDPALHFLRDGYKEGRDPGPKFSVKRYLDAHPEVRDQGNPLIHAIETGTTPAGTVDGAGS